MINPLYHREIRDKSIQRAGAFLQAYLTTSRRKNKFRCISSKPNLLPHSLVSNVEKRLVHKKIHPDIVKK